jgi:hypothetical protein
MRRYFASLLSALAICAQVAVALAGEGGSDIPLRLGFEAAAGCPDRQTFLAQLHARSARIREGAPGEDARAMRVELVADGGEITGRVTLSGANGDEGDREVRGADCETVARGLSLVAAVILDPSAAPEGAATTDATGAPTSEAREAPTSDAPNAPPVATAPSSPRPPQPPRLFLGWALEAAWGLGLDPQILPRVFVDVELPALPAGPSARLSVGRGFTWSEDTASGTADLTLTEVRFEPCLDAWSSARFRGRACGVLDVGVLSGEGKNTIDARREIRGAIELGVGVRPTWLVSDRIALGVLLATSWPLARYRFYFAPDATAYRLAPWSAVGEFDVGVRIW